MVFGIFIEGKYFDAAFSFVALIPLLGDLAGKGTKWGSKSFKAAKLGSNVIEAGSDVLVYGKKTGKTIGNLFSSIRETWEKSSVRKTLQKFITDESGAALIGPVTGTKKLTKAATEIIDNVPSSAYIHADEFIESAGKTKRIAIPGDADFVGPIPGDSWKLSHRGQGAQLIERINVKGRPKLSVFDTSSTPRYYPYGTPENAGQAHIRLHQATREAGINLRGGNPNLTDEQLIKAYRNAYSNPSLEGILGDLRTPNSKIVVRNLTPAQAFEELLKWGKWDKMR